MADDVLFNLEGDATGAVDALQLILDMLSNVSDALTTVADALSTFGDSSSGFTLLQEGALAADEAFMSLSDTMSIMAADLSGASDAALTCAAALELIGGNTATTVEATTTAATSAVDLSDALDIVSTGADNVEASMAAVASTLNDANIVIGDVTVALDDNTLSWDNVSAAMQNAAAAGAAVVGSMGNVTGTIVDNTAANAGNAAAAEEAAVAQSHAGNSANESAMAALMLAPILIKTATGFATMGMNAQTAMAQVTGLADPTLGLAQNSAELNAILATLGDQATKYGVQMDTAAKGLYMIMSAGFNTADAMTVLKTSMKAAAATGTNMESISTALTGVMHAYDIKASGAARTTDMMVQAVVNGEQKFSDFASVIGKTAAAGAAAGISFDQVLAAESTMTQIVPSVQRDTQNLSHLFVKLSTDTLGIEKRAKALGENFSMTTFKSKDLIGQLKYLSDMTGGNAEKFKAVLGDATSYGVALDLLSNKGQTYAKSLKSIQDSNGAMETAFKQTSATIQFTMQRIGSVLSLLSMKLVTAISPAVTAMFTGLADVFGQLAGNTEILYPLLGAIAGIIGGVLLAAVGALWVMFGTTIISMVTLGLAFGALGASVVALVPYISSLVAGSQPLTALFLQMKSSALGLVAEFKNIGEVAKNILGPIFESVGKSVIAQLVPAFMQLATQGMRAMTDLGNGIESALVAAKPLFIAIGQIITGVLTPAFIAFANGLGSTVFGAISKFGAFLQSVSPQIQAFGNWVEQKVVPALMKLGPVINQVANTLGKMSPMLLIAGGAFALLLPRIGAIAGIATAVWESISGLGGAIMSLGPAVNVGANIMRGLGGALWGLAKAFANPVRSILMLGTYLEEAWLTVSQFAFELIGPLISAISSAAAWFSSMGAIIATSGSPLMALQIIVGSVGAELGSMVAAAVAAAAPFVMLGIAVAAVVTGLVLFFTQTKQGAGFLQVLWKEIQSLWGVLVSALQPALQQIQTEIKRLAPLWAQMGQLFEAVKPILMVLGAIIGTVIVVAIGLFIANIAAIITILGKVIQGVIMFVSGFVQAFTGLVQVISGIIAFIIDLFTGQFGKLGPDLRVIGQGLVNIWQGIWHMIVGIFTGTVGAVISGIGAFGKTVIGFFQNMWSVVVGHSIWPDMWKGVVQHTQTQTKVTQTATDKFSTGIVKSFSDINVQSTTQYTTFWANIQKITVTSMNNVVSAVSSGMHQMVAVVISSMSSLASSVNQQWQVVVSVTTKALTSLVAVVQQSFKQILAVVQQVMQQIATISTQVWSQMAGSIKTAQDTLATSVSKSWANMYNVVKTAVLGIFSVAITGFYGLVSTIPSAMTVIEKIVDANWALMLNMSKMTMAGMVDAVKTGMKNLSDTMKDGAKDVLDQVDTMLATIKKEMDDLAKNAEDWGKHFDEGFAKGIESGQGIVAGAVDKLIQQITSKMQFTTPKSGPLSTYKSWMPHMVQGLATTLHASAPILSTAAAVTAQRLADAIKLKTEKATAAAAEAHLKAELAAERAAAAAAKKTEQTQLANAKAATAAAKAAASTAHSSSSNVGTSNTNSLGGETEVINLLQQILGAIEALGQGGNGSSGGSSVGYSIPSTSLGTISQQFNGGGSLSSNQVAGLYQQLNQLGGLSTEYAARGASSGVGF